LVLAEKQGFLVHAALLAQGRSGICFVGPSGAGKSTLSRNARRLRVISDDMCAVRRVGKTWYGCSFPFLHKDGTLTSAEKVILSAVYWIRHGRKTRVRKMKFHSAAEMVSREIFIPFAQKDLRRNVYMWFMDFMEKTRPRELVFCRTFDPSWLLGRNSR